MSTSGGLHPSFYKPPVLLPEREEPFVCVECLKPGWGPPGKRVHSGKCRAAHTRAITLRAQARRKQKKQAAACQ